MSSWEVRYIVGGHNPVCVADPGPQPSFGTPYLSRLWNHAGKWRLRLIVTVVMRCDRDRDEMIASSARTWKTHLS